MGEGEIQPSHLSVEVHKKGLNQYALLFLQFSSRKIEAVYFQRKLFGELEGGGKCPLPYISLRRQKGSNYSASRRVNTGAVLDNVTKKQRKVRIFLPTCPRPSDKRVFLLFLEGCNCNRKDWWVNKAKSYH